MYSTDTHTDLDHASLTERWINPATVEPRHQPVRCSVCRRPTMNLRGGCNQHYIAR
jgi:hypothetical protein